MNRFLHYRSRLVWFTLLASLPLQLFAQNLAAVLPPNDDQNKLQQEKKSLVAVLEEISDAYSVNFLFEETKLKQKFVNSEADTQEGLDMLLQKLLLPLGFTAHRVDDKTYIVKERDEQNVKKVEKETFRTTVNASLFSSATAVKTIKTSGIQTFLHKLQAKNVSGKVVDAETGEALPGVNVLVKNSTNGTVTDIEGQYNLTVADNAEVLVFSSVGYATREVTIGDQSTIDVQLTPDIQALSEVVVVGYGTQERAKVTGAISSVSGEEIDAMPVPSVDAALQGRAAGVNVTNSGSPGVNPQVRIRGIGTIGNNDPLYVIDGMPAGGLNAINPNDIESIEILKDAATAAIYGSRASNGVIMITTKKGAAGGIKVNLDSYYGVQNAWRQLDLLNREQYIDYGTDLQENAGAPVPQRFTDLGEYANIDTDWQDAMFQTAPIQDHNLNILGGTEKATFNVGGGYFKQEGIMLGTGFDRISFRVNTDFDLGRINIGNTLTMAQTNRNVEPFSGGRSQIEHMIKSVPYMPIYDPTRPGGFRAPDRVDGSDPANPVLNALLFENTDDNFKMLGTAYATLDIIEGLQYKFLVGLDMNFGSVRNFVPIYDAGDFAKNPTADLDETRSTYISPLISNQLNYSRTFGDHTVGATAVVERQTFTRTTVGGAGQNTISNDIPVLGSVSSPTTVGEEVQYALISYVGRVNYDFAGKYLLSASIRRDGGSRFSEGSKWGIFPAVSAGWRVSEEPFMSGLTFISDLKIRGSWGLTGNDKIGNYAYQSTFSGNYQYNFNGNFAPAYAIRNLANPTIRWETIMMTNFGVDLGLFNDKFRVSVEYFNNESRDLLLTVPIPPSLGYDGAPTANVGTVTNRGFEATAGFFQSSGNLQWSLNGNISFVNNELLSLGVGNTIFGPSFEGDPLTYTEEGMPIAYFYGLQVDGIFQDQQEIEQANALDGDPATPYQNSQTSPGDIRFRDINDDGVITSDDRTNIGHFLPDFTYGINADANWKNFDVSMFIQGVSGNEILNTNIYDLEGMTRLFNAGTAVLDRWTPENRDTSVPRAITGDPNRNARLSDRYIEDGSYLRIKNLTIGYSLPASLLANLGENIISRVRFYVSSQNLLTLTDYTGYDPEIGVRSDLTGTSASLSNGVDFGQFPQARTFLAGIQIGF